MAKKLVSYVWKWIGGGSDIALAYSKADAVRRAKEIGAYQRPPKHVNMSTLHLATSDDIGMREHLDMYPDEEEDT